MDFPKFSVMAQFKVPIFIFAASVLALITKELVQATVYSVSPKNYIQIRAEEPPIEIPEPEVPEDKTFFQKLSFFKDLCD